MRIGSPTARSRERCRGALGQGFELLLNRGQNGLLCRTPILGSIRFQQKRANCKGPHAGMFIGGQRTPLSGRRHAGPKAGFAADATVPAAA